VAFEFERAGGAMRLRPFTTREKRCDENDEYLFRSGAQIKESRILWSYSKSGSLMG
jgi:hypothetical protein